MAIYDKNGNEVEICYKADGTRALYAFNKDGEQVYPPIDPTDYNLKVMTYNVQGWAGLNAWQYSSIIFNKYDADIIGTQESSVNSNLVNLGYPYTAQGPAPNSNVVFSKYQLSDITSNSYDSDHYAGKRGYQKMYFTFEGKRIALFNTHLETASGSMYQYPQV